MRARAEFGGYLAYTKTHPGTRPRLAAHPSWREEVQRQPMEQTATSDWRTIQEHVVHSRAGERTAYVD
jgi:hypothetical protein